MAELGFFFTQVSSSSGGSSGASVSVFKRSLVRTGGAFLADTPLNLNTPGAGWVANGDLITISGASDFTENTQFYRNGQLLLTGENSSADNDVYFVSSTATVAFESFIQTNDVLQIWKFTTSSG